MVITLILFPSGSMVNTGESYGVNETKVSVSETTSSLVIRGVSRRKQQMGRYQCVAKNSLGKDVKSVNIYRESHYSVFKSS